MSLVVVLRRDLLRDSSHQDGCYTREERQFRVPFEVKSAPGSYHRPNIRKYNEEIAVRDSHSMKISRNVEMQDKKKGKEQTAKGNLGHQNPTPTMDGPSTRNTQANTRPSFTNSVTPFTPSSHQTRLVGLTGQVQREWVYLQGGSEPRGAGTSKAPPMSEGLSAPIEIGWEKLNDLIAAENVLVLQIGDIFEAEQFLVKRAESS